MKGFLTFTLAAGVAITTTSIAQAEGVTKGPATAAPMTFSAPGGALGSLGLVLDRTSLVREIERLGAQIPDQMNEGEDAGAPVRTKTGGSWAW